MVNPELVKLVSLILVALVIGVGGQILINKNRNAKKKELEEYSQGGFDSQSVSGTLLESENKAKEYIELYKSQYPRESIKAGLINMSISENQAEIFLNKYF